jgi:hypothetical protein
MKSINNDRVGNLIMNKILKKRIKYIYIYNMKYDNIVIIYI